MSKTSLVPYDILLTVEKEHGKEIAEKLSRLMRYGLGLMEMRKFDLGEDANHIVDLFYDGPADHYDMEDYNAWSSKLEKRP